MGTVGDGGGRRNGGNGGGRRGTGLRTGMSSAVGAEIECHLDRYDCALRELIRGVGHVRGHLRARFMTRVCGWVRTCTTAYKEIDKEKENTYIIHIYIHACIYAQI